MQRIPCRAWPAWVAASAVTSATTVGSTLVSGFLESGPPHRYEVISSGHGWPLVAGLSTAASWADWPGLSGTVRPTTTSSPSPVYRPGDHDVGVADRSEDSADDDLAGCAVLHLSSGSLVSCF